MSLLDDPLIGRLVIVRDGDTLRPGIVLKHEGDRCLVSVQVGGLYAGCTARNVEAPTDQVRAYIRSKGRRANEPR